MWSHLQGEEHETDNHQITLERIDNTMFALTNQEIAARCPQVFETSYSARRTQKYGQLTTATVIDALRTEGYEVTNAFAQSVKAGKRPTIHNKHCVRLSHRDFLDTLQPTDERPEIVIVNSHDGSSSFRIMAGIFRLVCSNGLIVATDMTANQRVCHWKGNSLEDVITASLMVAEQAKESYELIEQMKATNLTEKQQKSYAQKAAEIRMGFNKNAKVNFSENLLIPQRHDDTLTPSIWNTYNVVQENCIKGGQLVGSRILRPLTNISQNVEVNRQLWNEAVALIA